MGYLGAGRGLMVVAATTLALTVGAVLPAISHAAAQTYCVHQAGFTCPAGTVDEGINLQTALTSAAANASTVTSPNVITIGPGIYPPDTSGTGFSVTSASNPIQIIGSGIGQTTLTDPAALAVLHLQWPAGSSVSELTVSGTDDTGIDMTGGTANDVAVAPGRVAVHRDPAGERDAPERDDLDAAERHRRGRDRRRHRHYLQRDR